MAKDEGADEQRDRYKQALEAKKAAGHHGGPGSSSSGSGAKGDTHKAGGKREFRRKSG